jgi:hypothetical protein
VDAEGIVVDEIPPDCRLVYVTPAHQFPLGVPMSPWRRSELVAWAGRHGAAILEDDYDSEFRFTDDPLESLYGELASQAPDELTIQAGFISGPDGAPMLFINPTWTGDPTDGAHWVKMIEELGTPARSLAAPTPYIEPLRRRDQMFGLHGWHWAIRTRTLGALTAPAVAALGHVRPRRPIHRHPPAGRSLSPSAGGSAPRPSSGDCSRRTGSRCCRSPRQATTPTSGSSRRHRFPDRRPGAPAQ